MRPVSIDINKNISVPLNKHSREVKTVSKFERTKASSPVPKPVTHVTKIDAL